MLRDEVSVSEMGTETGLEASELAMTDGSEPKLRGDFVYMTDNQSGVRSERYEPETLIVMLDNLSCGSFDCGSKSAIPSSHSLTLPQLADMAPWP